MTLIDETRLRHLYLDEQQSIRAIAALEGVPTRLVYDALIRYRIPRRRSGFRSAPAPPDNSLFDEAELRRLYHEEQRSVRDIAALFNISTRMVYDAMSRYRIPRRTAGQRRAAPLVIAVADGTLDEAALRRMYEEEGQSIAAIAAAAACTPARIRNALIRWGIARRRRGRRCGPALDNRSAEQQEC
jgi:transposase-like protein